MSGSSVDYDLKWEEWDDMIIHSPAPRHRRRIMLGLIKKYARNATNLCDVGCGNGFFLNEVKIEGNGLALYGLDVASKVIKENRVLYVDINFQVIDLHKEFKSVDKCFDVVTCSEVLEHVGERTTAIRNLALLLNKGGYLILTVPRGKIFPIDQSCGHLAHFNDVEIFSKYFYIRENHQWGFPFFNLYKWAINLRPSAISRRFLNKKYSLSEKIVSEVIYFLFFLNINRFGYQQILVLEKK